MVRWAAIVVLMLLLAGIWQGLPTSLLSDLVRSDLAAADKLRRLQAYFASLGPLAPLVYVGFVTVEVVIAPLPGAMLYAPGGLVFGGFWGGFLSLAGNCIGAILACQMAGYFRATLMGYLANRQQLLTLQSRVASRGVLVVFLLRVNPLTSSDLVSYAAGLTEMPTWKLTLGTAIGMAPLCWIQAYAADRMLTSYPALLYPTLIACAVYFIICGTVIWRLCRQAPALAPASAVSPRRAREITAE